MELKSGPLERGFQNEDRAVQFLKNEFGLVCFQKNLQTLYSEVDLVCIHPQNLDLLYLIEVKSVQSFCYLENRIREKQKSRLRRAGLFLGNKYACKWEILYVYVSSKEALVLRDYG